MLVVLALTKVEAGTTRLCRTLIPAFNPDSARVVMRGSETRALEHAGTTLVTLTYRVDPTGAGERLRSLSCRFERADDGAGRDDRTGELVEVATERGPIGPMRFYLLKKHWIDSGRAVLSDPQPVSLVGAAPDLPQAVAAGLQQALSALPAISIYALLATSYGLIYGLVGRINLVFGELAMLAGYGAFLGFSLVGAANNVALAAAWALITGIGVALAYGAVLARLVLQPLAGRPGQHMLIATIGCAIAASELVRLTQGAGIRWLSPLLNRPIGVARSGDMIVTVTPMALLVFLAALATAVATLALMQASRFGRAWRASADDRLAAELCGVDPRRVLAQTMLLAAALAGLGGVLTTLFYGGIGHSGGLVVGLKALIAAIIGGIGSIRGALLGGLLLGLAETAWSAVFRIEYREVAIFAGLAVMLILRPGGLLGHGELTPRQV